jgi:hypothetical protein
MPGEVYETGAFTTPKRVEGSLHETKDAVLPIKGTASSCSYLVGFKYDSVRVFGIS